MNEPYDIVQQWGQKVQRVVINKEYWNAHNVLEKLSFSKFKWAHDQIVLDPIRQVGDEHAGHSHSGMCAAQCRKWVNHRDGSVLPTIEVIGISVQANEWLYRGCIRDSQYKVHLSWQVWRVQWLKFSAFINIDT